MGRAAHQRRVRLDRLPPLRRELRRQRDRAGGRERRAARHLRHPHVSPDGRRLAATAYRSDEAIDNAVEQPGQLLLFDVASALPIRELTTGASDRYPSFSPDGSKIVFERSGSVRVIGASGGRVGRLVTGTQPTWGR